MRVLNKIIEVLKRFNPVDEIKKAKAPYKIEVKTVKKPKKKVLKKKVVKK